jgi:hypothetical protein
MGKLYWGGVLVLGALLILSLGSLPARGDGPSRSSARSSARGSDLRQFSAELQKVGALKFYDETEDMLRGGKFEQAFSRYLFLSAHIRGQALDTGLAASVDQRLQFLRGQMHLGEGALHYEYKEISEKRRRQAKPVCPPPAAQTAKAKESSPEEKTPEMIIPPPPAETKATPPQEEEKKPPGEEAQKPAPAPSVWGKLKRRLKFW